MRHHELIGIGFGPSNIALAISLREHRSYTSPTEMLFIEKQPAFAWHRHMMLDHAHMQISFLKDLATLRNPQSRFTFINYLYEQGRLPDFINLKSFYPSRREFNDYLCWAASQFADHCAYGEEVMEVLPQEAPGPIELLRVRSRDSSGRLQERLTRNLVVSVGGEPSIPSCFRGLQGDSRVFHSNSYLQAIAKHSQARRIAIVGGGQSAAEIFIDLHHHPAAPNVDLILRGRAIRPADDSPFVNEVFNTEFTDYMFQQPADGRAALLKEFRNTNYAAPDLELIQQIFKVFYEQKVTGPIRHRMLCRHEIRSAQAQSQDISLSLFDLDSQITAEAQYDLVILATGYNRTSHRQLLAPLAPYLSDLEVDRHYRISSTSDFHPQIFLQGACESSHGLSDTLLSVTALRTMEIARALDPAPHGPSSRVHDAETALQPN
ncbi:MAG: lysine N(6)-hydroxylase/L-ornithine N(5)-oxygenase family protein [Acidovorax sp.]